MRVAKAATGGKAIATGLLDGVDLALDPLTTEIYWADFGSGLADDGTLGKVGTDGTGQTLIAASLPAPESVRISGSYLVWLSNGATTPDANAGTVDSTGTLTRQPK